MIIPCYILKGIIELIIKLGIPCSLRFSKIYDLEQQKRSGYALVSYKLLTQIRIKILFLAISIIYHN